MKVSDDLRFRGLVHQITDEAILGLLDAGGVTGYVGFDPTAPSLHLGHLLQLCTLRRLQLAGNRPIVLAGGGTGLIGDPSFKDDERPLLTKEKLAENLAGVRVQLAKFLDFSDDAGASQARLLDNSAWLTTVPLTDFLRDVGKHFTINQMIAREAVRSRLERPDVGLSFTEFSYMLLQAYDFYRLYSDEGCTLQLGGSDQWGNIVAGVELIRKMTGAHAYAFTSPLLVRSDGRKYGKSEAGNEHVWLDAKLTSPFRLHQFLLNADDELMPMMLRFYTFLSHEQIVELDGLTTSQPQARHAQRAVADAVVSMVHSPHDAQSAARAAEALFSEAIADLDEATLLDVIADAPSTTMSREEFRAGVDPTELLVRTALATSKGEARRFLDQGGFYVNNVRCDGASPVTLAAALHSRYLVLRRGKRASHLVVLQ